MNEPYEASTITPTDAALTGWTVDDTTLVATGKCPRCTETTTQKLSSVAVALGRRGAARRTQGFVCQCGGTHFDGAVQQKGCGARWAGMVEVGATPSVTATAPGTTATAAIALASGTSPVREIRASAEKWITAVTTLLGLYGIAGVAFGKDAVAGLSGTAKISFGIVTAAALVLALLGVLLIFRAAHGWPIVKRIRSDQDIRDWFAAREDPVATAKSLRQAVGATVGSVLLLGTAVGVLWYWPQASLGRPLVVVALIDGSAICGSLEDTTATSHFAIKDSSGSIASPVIGQIAAVKVVAECK